MARRVGYGSYERRNREQSKEVQYNRLLGAVNKHAKHVLEDLNGEPFRLYLEAGLGFNAWGRDSLTDEEARKLARERLRHTFNHPTWQRNFEGVPAANKRKEAFRQSLIGWSRRTHLDSAWCREAAYETLNDWSFFHPTLDELKFRPFAKAFVYFPTGRPEKWFSPPQGLFLHPQLYTLEEIEAELHRQVNRYIRDLKARAKAKDFVLTPEEYKTKNIIVKIDFVGWSSGLLMRSHIARSLTNLILNTRPLWIILLSGKQ